jgi:hypothetical protein
LAGGIVSRAMPPASSPGFVFFKSQQNFIPGYVANADLADKSIEEVKMLPSWRITISILGAFIVAIAVIKQFEVQPEARTGKDTYSAEKHLSAAPAKPSTWGAQNCSTLNPFAGSANCNVSAQTEVVTKSNTQVDVSLMIENTMQGDIGFFEDYLKHSRKCREVLPTSRPLEPSCHPSVLEANDTQFVAIASRMAQNGVEEAQLAMGNWWLAKASYLARSKSASEPQQNSADQALLTNLRFYKLSGIEPSAYLALSESLDAVNLPKFESIESRSAAQTAFDYFALAAAINNEASMAILDLHSQGIRARLKPTP